MLSFKKIYYANVAQGNLGMLVDDVLWNDSLFYKRVHWLYAIFLIGLRLHCENGFSTTLKKMEWPNNYIKWEPFIYSLDDKFKKTFLRNTPEMIPLLSFLWNPKAAYPVIKKKKEIRANPPVKQMSQIISRGKKIEFVFIFKNFYVEWNIL